MGLRSLLQLLLLAALWGGSFLFMRMAAPVIGPAILIEFRLLFAALFLLAVALLMKRKLQTRKHWKHYAMLGWFNSALPFLLLAYAAQTLSASLLSILNATAPIWGSVLIALRFKTKISLKNIIGLLLGIAGVALLLGFDTNLLLPGSGIAVITALGAAFSYGIASTYAQGAASVEPFANAHGSMWAATFLLIPLLPLFPAQPTSDSTIIGAVILLGIFCTGVAYLLYFRLIAEVGAASALTVVYLVPIFGVLWGYLLLNEPVGWHTLLGGSIILTGTALVTGFNPRALLRRRATANV
ncbi:DMT family transporter [Amphritea balenae]|uniref:DMT family transporter n=1 Tax=Amphritea balenae TaxID=452629 RepID=A0A3P1SJN6_9GAMM|nr:DMT family transporter [Amphritea balenae]RRC97180.1 DMT family transporter [Amphritea balenae]GGK63938.1 membrane protein [Amphritea balenae]